MPPRHSRWLALAACLVLVACETAVHVDATSDVSARYSSVLVTVEEIWFNESAAAVPADATWQKFVLDETITIDLVDITGGEFTRIASKLEVPAGTYRQVRVFLASRDESLHDSADDAGATYNNEVTWFDEDGAEDTVPLEILSPDQGIGLETELDVEEGTFDTSGTSSGNDTTVQLVFDATRDLTEFRYSGRTGFLLNSTLKAFDASDVGTIRGTLNLSPLNFQTRTGRPEIQVTAQKLDEALGRRVIIGSASVSATGSFVLYPLPLAQDEDTTEYDLVIHGPRIQTIIILDVPVAEATPSIATAIDLGGLAPALADSFEANLGDNDPVVPRGARVGFYQTLPGENEPHLIDVAAVDPVRGRFAQPVALTRAGTILHGTYGANLAFRQGTPEEGAARYSVAALSPHYGEGELAGTLLQPASQASGTAIFNVPAIGVPASAVPGTISATVAVETPGRYDSGVLLVSQEGAVVTVVSLDATLQQLLGSTFVEVAPVPGGTTSAALARGLYYLEAWTWNSADPEDTFTRHQGADAVDLRAMATATGSLIIR